MKLSDQALILNFIKENALARKPMLTWMRKVEAARWHSQPDVKQTFNSADYVNGKYVFNVGGNNYRIVALVIFPAQIVTILKVGTHAEYSRWVL